MCLTKVTVKRTLKKPKVVWGLVSYCNDIEKAICQRQYYDKRILLATDEDNEFKYLNNGYDVGFHKLINKNDSKYLTFNYDVVLKFIIPANTKVQYGYETWYNRHIAIIVSPILINPRITPELSNLTIADILDYSGADLSFFENELQVEPVRS